jgi:large subunit ribosomal protein L32e
MRVKHPKFNRQNIRSRGGRIKAGVWRKPHGIDNKLRIKRKGYGSLPKIGFQGPRATRHMHPVGKFEVLAFTPQALDGAKNVVVRIGGTVGGRKRIMIIEKAKALGLKVLNPGKIFKKNQAVKKETAPAKTEAKK